MTAKQLWQVPLLLHRFTWMDKEMWQSCEKNILRMLHKYNARDMAYFLDIFDRDYLDKEGEPYTNFKRANPEFFERIVALLPMHIPHL